VTELLRQPDVAFVLVSGPDPLSVDEALAFQRRLREQSLPLGGFVINRIHPRGPEAPSRGALIELLEGRPELRGFSRDDVVQLAAYCLLVDETHLHFAGYGYLRYANRTFKIDFTDTMRAELLRTAERLRADLAADDVDPDHDDPRRCVRCPVRVPCGRPVTA